MIKITELCKHNWAKFLHVVGQKEQHFKPPIMKFQIKKNFMDKVAVNKV